MIRVGQKLQEERIRLGYSLEDVAKATRIRTGFLKSIEEGNYKSLPSVTYVQGFVKNYIDFLGLSEKSLLALFRREFNEKEYAKIVPENISANREISLNAFRIRQALILGSIVLIGLVLYIFFQYHAAFFSPSVNILSPKEQAVINSSVVLVSGKTDPNASVTINAIPVLVDQSGSFSKQIPLFSGSAVIVIKATNPFGKTTLIQRHVTVN